MKTSKKPQIKWSITRAAVEFGTTRESLKKAFTAAGVDVKAGSVFTTAQIHSALSGDLTKVERAALLRAQTHAQTQRNLRADGKLIEFAAVESFLREAFSFLFAEHDRDASELPPALVGRDTMAVAAKLRERTERLRGALTVRLEQMLASR